MNPGPGAGYAVALVTSSVADRRLLNGFVGGMGHRVIEPDPHALRLSDLHDADMVLADRAAASRHREGLIALKQRQPGWILPMLVLMPAGGEAAPWLRCGYDDVLRYPISKADLKAQFQTHLDRRRESQAAYRNLFANAPIGLCRADPDGRILMANPVLARLLGRSDAEALRGQRLPEGAFADLLRPEATSLLPVVVREARWRRQDGTEIIVRERARAVHDEHGRLLYVEGTVEDVTNQRKLQHQLQQSQKMEALGRLAGGIAHDFNNLLTVIVTGAEMMRLDLPEDSPLSTDVEDIRGAAERAAALTRQLLAFGSRQPSDLRVGDLNAVILDVERLLRRTIGEDVTLVLDLADALGTVRLDPIQIEQILVNLVVNARDAMPGGGRITVRTRSRPADPGSEETGYVLLSVTDTGTGMDEDTLTRLWEPFFTTKGSRGTGLGLPTVYGIVNQLGGTIHVESTLGKGSTFEIRLPLADGPPVARAPERPVDEAGLPGGTETILVIEDEEQVRLGVGRLLRRLGYEVIETRGAGEALLKLEAAGESVDLVLTDVVMPDMSGPELIARLGEQLRAPVLFMSGYTSDLFERHGTTLAAASLLAKPFTPSQLAVAVRRLLDERGVG